MKEGLFMCKHEKKYDHGIVLTSFPPKHPWICKKCGERGYDVEEASVNIYLQQLNNHKKS